MVAAEFYLLGESVSSTKEIDLGNKPDLEDVQHIVAAHYAIVTPSGKRALYSLCAQCAALLTTFLGVGFLYDNHRLTAVADITSQAGPVAITINGGGVREIPGPAGLPYFGNYLEIFPDHLGNHMRLFEKYGPLIKTNTMGNTIYQTNDPELATIAFAESDFFSKRIIPGHPLYPIKSVEAGVFLGDTDTEEWRLAHKFLPPALGPKAVRHYAPTMQKSVEEAFKVFDELDDKGEAWNVYQYMLKLGSQAVGKLVLGLDFAHFTSVDAPLHEMVLRIAQNLELNKRVSTMPSWYLNMPFGDPKKLRQIKARIEEIMMESIAAASKGQDDLELQDAALSAENVVGMYLFLLFHCSKLFSGADMLQTISFVPKIPRARSYLL